MLSSGCERVLYLSVSEIKSCPWSSECQAIFLLLFIVVNAKPYFYYRLLSNVLGYVFIVCIVSIR